MSLITITRNHTRNKISTCAEVGIDKDVRGDISVGQGGGMQRQRWRKTDKNRKEQGLRRRKRMEKTRPRVVPQA